jgi:hypothetical protein
MPNVIQNMESHRHIREPIPSIRLLMDLMPMANPFKRPYKVVKKLKQGEWDKIVEKFNSHGEIINLLSRLRLFDEIGRA